MSTFKYASLVKMTPDPPIALMYYINDIDDVVCQNFHNCHNSRIVYEPGSNFSRAIFDCKLSKTVSEFPKLYYVKKLSFQRSKQQ